jgi:hypothetical protein
MFSPTSQSNIMIQNSLVFVNECCVEMDPRLAPLMNRTSHELAMLQRGCDDKFTCWPEHGGNGITYRSVRKSRGGGSNYVVMAAAKRVREYNVKENGKRSDATRAKINNKISLAIGTHQSVTYRNGHAYLIDDAGKQMQLQQSLGVSDAQFQDFGKEFFRQTAG